MPLELESRIFLEKHDSVILLAVNNFSHCFFGIRFWKIPVFTFTNVCVAERKPQRGISIYFNF